ncbi:MAG TPA: hypothetical protein VHV57_09505 [Acidimicrobiales bacterium]|nr:hypothetical protein [Acidimicrobiales bacterium]
MALAHEDTHRSRSGSPTRTAEQRRHGRIALAEVVPIRPESPPQDSEAGGIATRVARVFASLRSQATSVGSPPRSPSSPAPRSLDHPSMARPLGPDDAA